MEEGSYEQWKLLAKRSILLLFVFRRGSDYGSGYSLLCRPIAAQPTHTIDWQSLFFVNVFGVFCCYLISFFITIIISGNLGGQRAQRAQRAKVWMTSQNIFSIN